MTTSEKYNSLLTKIDYIKSLDDNWNSYGAPKMKSSIISNATLVLKQLLFFTMYLTKEVDFLPSYISPTPESIIFTFSETPENEFKIELYDDDDIVVTEPHYLGCPVYSDCKFSDIFLVYEKLNIYLTDNQPQK